MNLSENILIGEVKAPVAAATGTDSNSDILDMAGFDGVVFVVPVEDSVATGVATLTIEGNSVNSDVGMTALLGAVSTATSAAVDDLNGKLLVVDVYRPGQNFIQGVVTSAVANIAFGTMTALRYMNGKRPVVQDASVLQRTLVVSP